MEKDESGLPTGVIETGSNALGFGRGISSALAEAPAVIAPTPDQHVLFSQYQKTVVAHFGALDQAIRSVGTSCGIPSTCRAALTSILTNTNGFLADLNGNPPPACLQAVDTHLRNSLNYYKQAATVGIAEIDQPNADGIALGLFDVATGPDITRASSLIQQATC